MNIRQLRATFKVESESRPGKFYSVTLKPLHCDCPHFRVRLKKLGEDCKHIKAVRETLKQRKSCRNEEILEYVKRRGRVESIVLIEEFDEGCVNDLIAQGELIEKAGYIEALK